MNLRHYARRARDLPAREIARRASGRARSIVVARAERRRDHRRPTYGPSPGPLARLLPAPAVEDLAGAEDALASVTMQTLAHRADVLGSGWVDLAHGVPRTGLQGCRYEPEPPVETDPAGAWLIGRVNPANLAHAQDVWQLVDPCYQAIDWSVDLRSGHRWPATTWHRDVTYGDLPGVDVKSPWDLSRAHHLPQLALAASLAASGDDRFLPPDVYAREFRNQVLDFVATNPPRWGVNWRTAMDVGIRVVNWLVAHDMFRAQGVQFDESFEAQFSASVLDHATHVLDHLEWDEGLRANHYLADVASVVFAASYVPSTPETDSWLGFAIHQLILETGLQFGEDGANFEASTSYHRLSSEMVAYATGLVLSLPSDRIRSVEVSDPRIRPQIPCDEPPKWRHVHSVGGAPTPFPPWFVDRLEGMATFIRWVTKPNGLVAQIGDNDSGRFLRLVPTLHRVVPEPSEQQLDHRHLLCALTGLVRTGRTVDDVPPYERRLLEQLAGGVLQRSDDPRARRPPAISGSEGQEDRPAGEPTAVWVFRPGGDDLLANLDAAAFTDFGLFVWRSRRLFVAIRCGPVGQRGNGGHAHNDQLHVELNIDGVDWISDPGTFVYTPLPAARNAYRSVRAHFTPDRERPEPAPLDRGLFTLPDMTRARCLAFDDHGFLGRHSGRGELTWRRVRLGADEVVVEDWTPGDEPVGVRTVHAPEECPKAAVPFSAGYGEVWTESIR